jgi:hypothetical protein
MVTLTISIVPPRMFQTLKFPYDPTEVSEVLMLAA